MFANLAATIARWLSSDALNDGLAEFRRTLRETGRLRHRQLALIDGADEGGVPVGRGAGPESPAP